MRAYWVKFDGHKAGCVEAENESAAKVAGKELTGCEVSEVKSLPYPASPRLNPWKHPKHGVCPSFCFNPEKCAGNSSCPQRMSCVE